MCKMESGYKNSLTPELCSSLDKLVSLPVPEQVSIALLMGQWLLKQGIPVYV